MLCNRSARLPEDRAVLELLAEVSSHEVRVLPFFIVIRKEVKQFVILGANIP